jgi:hypothetical protein
LNLEEKDMEAYKNLIKDIESYISKLETASLTMDELFELEKLTRKLHERSIILRYKAFENKVGVEQAEVKEEPAPEPEPEVIEEPEAEEEEELEFNIFENEEEEENLGFVFEAPQDEVKPDEEEKEEEIEIEPKEDMEPQEVIPQPAGSTPEPAVAETQTTDVGGSFIDRFNSVDNSLSSQFAGSKLDSLIGAFGLNEKLMFINELFDGSSEMFSDAIKALDTKSSFDDASAMLDELANEHSWDPEEEAVAEFIVYIQRRHA